MHTVNDHEGKPMSSLYSRGSVGPEVKEIQAALNFHVRRPATPLVPDGIFGPLTQARVREFQQRACLSVDGIVGPKTLSVLYRKLQSVVQVKLTPIAANPAKKLQLLPPRSGQNTRQVKPASDPATAPSANAGVPSPGPDKPTKPQVKTANTQGFDFESSLVFDPLADGKEGKHVVRLTLKPILPWPIFLPKPLKLEIDASKSMTEKFSIDGKLKMPFTLLNLGPTKLSPYFFVGAGVNKEGYANLNTGAAAKFELKLFENAFGGRNQLSLFTDGGTKLQYDLDADKAKLKHFFVFGLTFGGTF